MSNLISENLKYYIGCDLAFGNSKGGTATFFMSGIDEKGKPILRGQHGKQFTYKEYVPIVHKLELDKPIWYMGNLITPITELLKTSNFDTDKMTFKEQCDFIDSMLFGMHFNDAMLMFKWRLDVFGWVDKNQAIAVTKELNPYKPVGAQTNVTC